MEFTYPPGSAEIDMRSWATQATLNLKDLPSSFSICSSVFPKSWVYGSGDTYVSFFEILNEDGDEWMYFAVHASQTTVFYAGIGQGDEKLKFQRELNLTEKFPIILKSWTRACITLDTEIGMARIVADGKVLKDAEYSELRNFEVPRNSTIRVGKGTGINAKFSDLNVFSEPLSLEMMEAITTPGGSECGSRGDFLNWDQAKWIMSDKWATDEWADWVLVVNASKMVELDWIHGPCWRPSKIKVYAVKNLFHGHSNCMMHCQKIGYGRSPSLMTKEDHRWLVQELEFLKDPKLGLNSFYELLGTSILWLSVTEGDSGEALSIILDEMSTLGAVHLLRNTNLGYPPPM